MMSTKCGSRDPEIQVLMFDIEALICNLLTEENPQLAGNYKFLCYPVLRLPIALLYLLYFVLLHILYLISE